MWIFLVLVMWCVDIVCGSTVCVDEQQWWYSGSGLGFVQYSVVVQCSILTVDNFHSYGNSIIINDLSKKMECCFTSSLLFSFSFILSVKFCLCIVVCLFFLLITHRKSQLFLLCFLCCYYGLCFIIMVLENRWLAKMSSFYCEKPMQGKISKMFPIII